VSGSGQELCACTDAILLLDYPHYHMHGSEDGNE
jgi:hypothetical protein